MAQGRIGGDPSTQERRNPGEIEVIWNTQNEAFIGDNAIGVATIGNWSSLVLVWGVVGEDHILAKLLKASFAMGTGTIRIDHTADRREITGLVLRHCRANLSDPSDDLMTGDDRVGRGHEFAPLVTHRMDIGVTDAAEENFDLNVMFGWIAPLDRVGG